MSPGRDDESFYRDLLQSVTEASPDLIYFKDEDRRLVHVGETYAALFDAEPEDLLGERAEDLWPEDWPAVVEDENRALAGETIIDREREVTHPDGTTHWYSVNKIPRYDEEGSVIGFFAIDREITEQKERELELERYRSFVEHASDIIIIIDAEGRLAYASPSIETAAGYDIEALEGERVFQYVHPEDQDAALDTFADIIGETGKSDTVEFRYRGAEGDWLWTEASVANRTDVEGIEGVVAILRDISDRKEKEAALRQNRERYRSLFENNPLVIWEEDFSATKRELDALAAEVDSLESYLRSRPDEVRRLLDTVEVIDVNQNAVEYYGADSKAHLLENLPEIFTEQAYEHLAGELVAIAEGATRYRMETVSHTLDGTRREEILDMYVPEAYSEDYSRVYLTSTDITERNELHQRLSVVNRILRHDIRSAVSIISGNADLAKHSERTLDRALTTIKSEAERLFRLAENARHIEGALSDGATSTQTMDLSEELMGKILTYRNEHPEVTIETDIPESAWVRASLRFPEAFEKVLENAIEHNDSPDPAVHVTVERASRDQDWVQVRVADNGPGIPEDEIVPIEQGEETDLTHTSGLGLWVLYWSVNESGGQLEFEENDPRGTVVTISLPAVTQVEEPATR